MASFPLLRHPIIAAPMAGGPSTPRLVAAVGRAGGLGFLAAGYKRTDQVHEEIRQVRQLSDAHFGVNIFAPTETRVDHTALAAYAAALHPDATRLNVVLGRAQADDDHFNEKIELLCAERVPVVSFVFGLPTGATIGRLQRAGASVLVTVATPGEAVAAEAIGADGIVAQGIEAGGHRGGFTDHDGIGEYGLLTLLRLVRSATKLPVIAAGGLADGASVAATLAAGARAAQLGTAFLRCPEAGTNPIHRAEIGGSQETTLTRVFTGRRARAIVNGFVRRHDGAPPPAAYPHVHHMTAPLRAAALSAGNPDGVNLWAGQAHSLTLDLPAADLVHRLATETRSALAEAQDRLTEQ